MRVIISLLVHFVLSICFSFAQSLVLIPASSLTPGHNVSIEEAKGNASVINRFLMEQKGRNARIQLPSGIFSIGSQVQIPSHTTLSGQGEKTVLSIHANFNGEHSYIVNANYNLGTYDTDVAVGLEQLTVDGTPNLKNANVLMGIFFNKVSQSRISSINVYGVLNEAIRIHSNVPGVEALNNSITNCVVDKRGLGSRCIMVSSYTPDGTNEGKAPALTRGIDVINCKVTGGDHGIMFFNVMSGRIEGNTCVSQLHRGIILSPTVTDVLIRNNRVDSAGSTGIHLAYGVENIFIEGNMVTNSIRDMSGIGIEGQGIKAYAGFKNVKIINNTCLNNATDGIALEGGGDGIMFEISGNTLKDNNRNGIRLWAGEISIKKGGDISGGTIQGNLIEGNLEEPIFMGSDNRGLNKVKKTTISKNNVLISKGGKKTIRQEFSHRSNSVLKK